MWYLKKFGNFRRKPSPVFIVGAPRSGTTLLRLMLDAHPDLAIPPETGFVPEALSLAGTPEQRREGLFRLIVESPAWPDFHLDASELGTTLKKRRAFTVAGGLRDFYALYAERFGKRGWGDKTPGYAKHLPSIAEAFPEAKFIHIIRDGRDVAVSLQKQWFSPGKDMETLARHWADHVDCARQAGACLGERYTETRYEELVAAPGAELGRLCARLDLEFHDAMTRPHERAPGRIGEHEERLLHGGVKLSKSARRNQQASTLKPPGGERIGVWRDRMTLTECREFERAAGQTLRDCAYPPASRPMRILITNTQLTSGTGTEQVTFDLAKGLTQRGHEVTVFCPNQGRFADRMRERGIRIIAAPDSVERPPDVIHGHHHLETMAALRSHPSARAIFVCHDGRQWLDHPPVHPRLIRYVAVDFNCRERLAALTPHERLSVIGNWFDSSRFTPRRPLPDKPRRALVFSNYARNDSPALQAIREACEAEGIALEVMGESGGTGRPDPESVLGEFDLVFAKGKCAIEALATGCAVIIFHTAPGPLVTTGNAALCRDWNFGLRLATLPLSSETVRREIRAYDAEDAARVGERVRTWCDFEHALDAYEKLYSEILDEPEPAQVDGDAMNLERLLVTVKDHLERTREQGYAEACAPLHADAMRGIAARAPDCPAALRPGETRQFVVKLINNSYAVINSAMPAPVHVSYRWEPENGPGERDPASPRTPLPRPVGPGEEIELTVSVVAPERPGNHRLRFTLVQEGVAWFEDIPDRPDEFHRVEIED